MIHRVLIMLGALATSPLWALASASQPALTPTQALAASRAEAAAFVAPLMDEPIDPALIPAILERIEAESTEANQHTLVAVITLWRDDPPEHTSRAVVRMLESQGEPGLALLIRALGIQAIEQGAANDDDRRALWAISRLVQEHRDGDYRTLYTNPPATGWGESKSTPGEPWGMVRLAFIAASLDNDTDRLLDVARDHILHGESRMRHTAYELMERFAPIEEFSIHAVDAQHDESGTGVSFQDFPRWSDDERRRAPEAYRAYLEALVAMFEFNTRYIDAKSLKALSVNPSDDGVVDRELLDRFRRAWTDAGPHHLSNRTGFMRAYIAHHPDPARAVHELLDLDIRVITNVTDALTTYPDRIPDDAIPRLVRLLPVLKPERSSGSNRFAELRRLLILSRDAHEPKESLGARAVPALLEAAESEDPLLRRRALEVLAAGVVPLDHHLERFIRWAGEPERRFVGARFALVHGERDPRVRSLVEKLTSADALFTREDGPAVRALLGAFPKHHEMPAWFQELLTRIVQDHEHPLQKTVQWVSEYRNPPARTADIPETMPLEDWHHMLSLRADPLRTKNVLALRNTEGFDEQAEYAIRSKIARRSSEFNARLHQQPELWGAVIDAHEQNASGLRRLPILRHPIDVDDDLRRRIIDAYKAAINERPASDSGNYGLLVTLAFIGRDSDDVRIYVQNAVRAGASANLFKHFLPLNDAELNILRERLLFATRNHSLTDVFTLCEELGPSAHPLLPELQFAFRLRLVQHRMQAGERALEAVGPDDPENQRLLQWHRNRRAALDQRPR